MRGPGGGRLPRAANPAAREATRIKAATEGTIRRTTRERRVRGARGCRAWDRTRGRSRPRPPASTRVTDAPDPSPCRRTPTRWPRRRRKRRAVGIQRRPLHPPARRTRGIRRRPLLPPRRRRPSTRRVSTAAAAARRTRAGAGWLGRRRCRVRPARLTSRRRRLRRVMSGRCGRRADRSTSGSRVVSSRIRRSGSASRLATPRVTPARLSSPSTRTRTARTRWRARWWRSFSSLRAT